MRWAKTLRKARLILHPPIPDEHRRKKRKLRHQESRFEESYVYQQLSIRRPVEQVRTTGTQKDPDSCL